MSGIPKTVERGAELLDEKCGPDWPERIDLDKLNLGDTCHCVLGQLHPRAGASYYSYYRGPDHVGVSRRDAWRYGFTTGSVRSFERLTAAWRRLIESRRAARA